MSPSWYFDGVLRRIYEVPPGATFTVNGGYRIYNGGTSSAPLLTTDVKKDLWSRWVDWHAQNDWALLAFERSGGNLRPTGEYASADFSLLTSNGWRIIMANYPHETVFNGNLFAEGLDSLFDITYLSSQSVIPRMQGSANLLTYNTVGGGGGNLTAEAVRLEMDANSSKLIGIKSKTDILINAPTTADIRTELADELAKISLLPTDTGLTNTQNIMLLEMYRLLGLDPTRPLIVTVNSRSAGADLNQTISTNTNNTIVTRNV